MKTIEDQTAGTPGTAPVLGARPKSGGKEPERDLRRFVYTGIAPGRETTEGWLPLRLHRFRDASRIRTEFPIFLAPSESEALTVLACSEFLEERIPESGETRILRDNLLRLQRGLIHRVEKEAGYCVAAPDALRDAGRELVQELALTPDALAGVNKVIEHVAAGLPSESVFAGLSPVLPLVVLHRAAASARDRERVPAFTRLRTLTERLRGYLESDRRKHPELQSKEEIQNLVGEVGSRFVDPERVSELAASDRGGVALSAERRQRLSEALDLLENFILRTDTDDRVIVEKGLPQAALAKASPGWQVETAANPCAAGIKAFDHEAEYVTRVIRSARLSQLELDGNYDPVRHDPWLAGMDWRSFSRVELSLLPVIAVWVSSHHLADKELPALSRGLLSGRPIQVLIERGPGTEEGSEILPTRFEPAYFAMSFRNTFVRQTAAARPLHLTPGLVQALEGRGPAVHFLADQPVSEKNSALGAWALAGAALESRAHPFFSYDPNRGGTWAERFDFTGNPGEESNWPVYELDVLQEDRSKNRLSLSFTFADFALLDPAWKNHFCPVAAEISDTLLITVDGYLGLSQEETEGKIPMVWGVDAGGRVIPLAVTRELVRACRDRFDFWHTLQELGGVRNSYVEDAVARIEAEKNAESAREREKLVSAHARELERARDNAAHEVIGKLTAALLDLEPGSLVELDRGYRVLDGFRNRDVGEVTDALIKVVGQESNATSADGGDQNESVNRVAAELLKFCNEEPEEKGS